MEEKRNIIPLMFESFDFGSPLVVNSLTGKLALLNKFNGIRIYSEFFFEAMDKLRERYLDVLLSDISLPELQAEAQEITTIQKEAASEAVPVVQKKLTAQEWFERGYVFQEAENYSEAIRCYSQSLQLDADATTAYNNLGVLYRNQKRFNEAAENAYRKAAELNPSRSFCNKSEIIDSRFDYPEVDKMYWE